MAGYWRSLASQAWTHAAGLAGGYPGPVHLNIPFREPLVPDIDPGEDWPETRRTGGAWTRAGRAKPGQPGQPPMPGQPVKGSGQAGEPGGEVVLPWTERGVVVCGDGDYDAAAVTELAQRAGWPVLAEPSSGARHGPNALSAYQYLLSSPEFMAAHRPELIISAGRPGLSRAQSAFLGSQVDRHVVLAQGPGRWADPLRAATDVAAAIRLSGVPAGPRGTAWLEGWRQADRAARRAVDSALDAGSGETFSEPALARDLAAALPEGALLWAGSSMPIRDLDCHLPPRDDIRVLASRGASGIDGTVSAAIGAALAHGGPAFALIGDLAFVHDMPGLALGPHEPRPDLCLIVVNNDGGGIFSTLEQAAFDGSDGPFERLFGTAHGTDLRQVAAAFGVPCQSLDQPDDLIKAVQGNGLRIMEVRTDRAAGAALRARLRAAAASAVLARLSPSLRLTPLPAILHIGNTC